MIKDIKELNFPSYATLSQATCALQDMAEKTITTQVKIDGAITPDFSYDWEIVFKGEKYIQPLRKPQAAKENTSLKSVVDLTFQHWAIYQLKRWMFFTLQPIESGTAVADQYIASVSLNLKEFCDLFGQVLQYYYGDSITIDLNPEWQYKTEPTGIEINYSYLWDILIKLYELYAVRWQIEPAVSNDNETKGGEKYVIKIGYPATELSHIFQYGFEGGLLKTEQQVQSEDIRNMLLGRGGEKNLPYRYFKDVDEENPSFPADPDWIPELANIYFPELRGATFRSYVQGWKAKHYGGTTTKEDSYAPWAWEKGYTDSKFIPVEYVKDDVSITKYGELLGGLENNNEIYPSIQGITLSPYGRIDEVVDVEQIESDDVEESSEAEAKILDVKGITAPIIEIGGNGRVTQTVIGNTFTVPAGLYGNFDEGAKTIKVSKTKILKDVKPIFINGKLVDLDVEETEIVIEVEGTPIQIESASVRVRNTSTGELLFASGIPEGTYRYEITYGLHNTSDEKLYAELSFEAPEAKVAKIQEQWGNTFDIWIKNIWGTRKLDHGETDEQYTGKVWGPILGDRQGNEAKVVFASGMLSTSEDYEFTIVDVNYDTSKSIAVKDEQGETMQTVQSEWRLTLSKSDADLESLGLYVPSTMRQGKAGDFFFFTGIDMPHKYVVWAEERIDDYKKDQLAQVCEIKPAWVVSLDKIRINNPLQGEAETILSALHVGSSLRLADSRFIINDEGSEAAYETLYLQSITYTYNEPTSDNAALMPDVEIVLSDKYETTASPVETMQGTIDAIQRQVGSISNIQQLIRAVGDKLYLRKDGISDRSMSPTKFFSLLTSGDFRNGIVGGQGWGLFKDENGNWVLEVDKVNIRKELQANNTVINQVTFRSGMTVQSAANIEAERVVETDEGYVCYFSQKGGNVANLFHVEDIAYSQRYTPENATLKYYKRKVIAVGSGSITLSKDSEYVDGSGIPEAGDNIVQFGNYIDATRQYVIVRDVIGGGYERYIEGLNSVTATGTEYYFVGKQNGENARWFVGNKSGDFIEWLNGKLNIKGSLSVESTIGEQSLNDYINSKIEINADNIQDYIKNIVNPLLEELQKQIDGAIETWFLPGEPTLENEPASQWTTDELKNVHLGDLYYDKKSGKCYRFQLDNDGSYYWQVITDTAIQAALDAAAKAQDTADGKRKVFVNQPTANDDYDIGDLWVNATYGDLYDNDVLRCNTPKAKGVAFSIEHWEKASKYTDDTVANQALSIAKGLSSNVEAAQNAVNMLRQYVDGAFSDSIISESEAKTIRAYLKNINTAAEDVSRSYAEVYANPLLPAKTKEALAEAKAAFDAATQTLISQINIAIEDGEISNEERASVDNAYNTFTTEYGDFRTAITKSINAILDLLNSNIAGLDYIKKALKQSTAIQGGLILSSLISLGINNEDYSTQETYSGINGIYDSSKRGGGIAAWYGGDMIDIFDYYNSETQKFEIPEKDSNENVIRPAKGVDRMDGSGYRANGALWWDTNGVVHADPLSFFVGEEQVGALLASFQVVYEEPEEGKIEPSYLIPKVPFQNLGVVGLLSAETIKIGSAYIKWDATNNALYVEGEDGATVGFYSKGWLSALGINGDTGGSVNYDRLDSWPTTWSDSYNTYVLSAKLGQDLRERIEELENGGVFSITPEGTGNAVTEIAKNGTSGIIVTKGLTFALQENVVTDIGVSEKSLTWTKNEEVQSLTVPYATLAKQFDTKYTLWGQSFQGNNVSGNMSNVGNVSPNANNTYTSGTSTLRWKNVYAQLLDVKGLATLTGGLSIGSYGITSLGVATLKNLISESFKATVGNVETLTSEQATLTKLKVSGEADLILKSLVSNGFIGGNDGKGVSVSETQNGAFRMEIDELLVRKIATFLKLEIRELSYVGGNIVVSKAGNEITKVESVAGGWKCYFTTNDGSKEVENLWKAGDQAKCQTVNLKEGTNENAGNKYYWRLVTETGDDYVVLSSSDKDDATDNDNPNCVPAFGDKIVQMGFRLSGDEGDKDRTSLIVLSTSGENTPRIEAYTGVVGYELSAEKRLFISSPAEVSFRSDMFRWMSGGVKFPQEVYRGDWESGTAYNYYDKVTHNGSTWICIATEGTSSEPAKGNAAWKEYAEKGADGTAGKGIKSITEYYLATSAGSGVTTGTSGWTTSVQTITAAKRFLWNYEVTAYTDGSSTKSSPVIIGVYGDKGEAGTSVKVSSTTITYAVGTSGTTPPDGGWSSNVPAVPAGQYLWGKTVVTYSDGKSTTTYSVSYQGTNGKPGDDGASVTITGQATKYAVTTTAGQPADSAFTSDKIPSLSPGDYLWSRTTVTYSSGVQTKSYAVSRIGTDGTDGLPGTDGKDSYTHFAYANSANGETGFSTTYFDGALYIGVCSDFNEADPTDYRAYSWARMKGETGTGYSPNMILHTKDMDGWNWGGSSWNIKQEIVKEADGGSYIKQTVTVTPASADPADNIQSYVWVRNGDTAIYKHMEKYPYELFTPGRKYTLSFEYKSDVPVRVQISVRGTGLGSKQPVELTVFPASAEWTRVSASGTCPGGINNEGYKNCLLTACIGSSQAGSDVAAGDTAYFRNFCLVEGEGTQWVPAASEMVGVDGVSVKAVKNMYKAGTSSTEAPEGTYVADVMQAGFSETNKYLWGYEINTLSDGKTIETTKHLVSVWGQTGNPGTDGTKIIPAELTTAFNATYGQWLTLYNQTVGKIWNVDNASDYRVGDIAVITGNVTDRGNIKASLYASVLTVNTAAGTIGTRSYSLVVGNQGEQGSSGVDAKRNLLLNSGVEKTANVGAYNIASYYVSPAEGVQSAGHVGSLVAGDKYTVVMCFTPGSVNTQTLRLYGNSNTLWVNFGVPKSGKNIYKATFTCSYTPGYGPDGTTDILVRLYYGNSGVASSFLGGTVHWIKIVKGETATDEWTPAPEDSNNFDVQVSPVALSFKTDEDDGSVIYSGNTATLTATHGGQPAKVSYVSSSAQLMGLTGLQNSGSGTETMKVTLTGISYITQELKVPNGTGYDTKQMQIPVTSGQAAFKVKLTYGGYTEERTITVPFTVDVKASLVSFGMTTNSIVGQVWDTNGVVNRLSKVEQTAGSITSTVESMLASSPNLLDGSKLRLVTTGESRHLYVRLTAGKWYMFSARAMINSTLLNGSQKLLVSCYETNPNGGWGANHTMVFDNTSWEIKKLDVAFQAQYTSAAHVYAVTVNSEGKAQAAVSGGAGFVDWVQLEECEPNSTVATAWKPSANDNVVRPSLVAADAWSFNSGVADVDDVLADGTTGKVKHINVPLTPYQAVEVVSANPSPLFVKVKTQYTISVWAKGTGSMNMFLRASQTAGVIYGKDEWQVGNTSVGTFNLTQEWQKYEATVTTGAAVTENAVCAARIYAGSEIWCYGWKVEKGGTATDSSLIDSVSGNFKSEIKQTADKINLSVDDLKTGVEAVGIKLDGENSTITLTGKKVKIEEGAEFNANNATFKNIKVEGILSSVVSTTGYDNRNYFIGDDCIPGAPLNILVTKMKDNAAGTEQHLFLPCDYDFIGSHVMILADNISDSAGKINTETLYARIYAGRNYMKHAYLTQGQGTSAAPYKISQEMLAVDDSAYAGTGHMLRDTYQQVFSGAQFFGRWRATADTQGDNISGSYAPDRITIVSGYIEFVGVPAPTATAILFPYKVELQTDNTGAQTDDSNSHLLKVSYVSKTVHFPVAMYGGSPVQDELYNKLKGLYDEKGNDGLPAGVTALGLRCFQYYNPTTKSVEDEYMQLFRVPLCRWYPTSLSALTSTGERKSSVGNITSVEGAVYQS